MKHPLLNIAVAEEIYGWKYAFPGSEKCYVTPSDPSSGPFHPVKLPNFLTQSRSLKLLRHVLETDPDPFKRASIQTPFSRSKDGSWSVVFVRTDGRLLFQVMGRTMEEAVVRACLLSRGVEVDESL